MKSTTRFLILLVLVSWAGGASASLIDVTVRGCAVNLSLFPGSTECDSGFSIGELFPSVTAVVSDPGVEFNVTGSFPDITADFSANTLTLSLLPGLSSFTFGSFLRRLKDLFWQPVTLALFGLGLVGLSWSRRK